MSEPETMDDIAHREFGYPRLVPDPAAELAALRERVRVQGEQIGALREALAIAKETIAEFHGTSGWDFYQRSPEMRKVNSALAATEPTP